MKIRFASTNRFKEKISYEFDGMKVKATCEGLQEELNFEPLDDGEAGSHTGELSSAWLKGAKKEDGEVYLVLYQNVGAGHWQHYSNWVDSSDYNDSIIYNQKLSKQDSTEYGNVMEYVAPEGEE